MKILIVDDDAVMRSMLVSMLEEVVESVDQCIDGQDALDYLDDTDTPPDIVLLDVIMPVLDGFQTAREIRKRYSERHLPILFLTSLEKKNAFAKCLFYGDDFIMKPVDRQTLLAKINAHDRIVKLYNQLNSQKQLLEQHHEKTQFEFSIVESIFSNLMRNFFDDCAGLAYHSSPQSTFNGDLLLVARRPYGGVYALLGDVTGHGLPSAILTIPIARTFNSMARKGRSIGSIAQEINAILFNYLPDGMMFAASLLEVQADGLQCSLWSGGLPDTLILNPDGQVAQVIRPQHMPLGVNASEEFDPTVQAFTLVEGQRLFLYTDGITEANNCEGQMFGEQRLLDTIAANPDTPFDAVLDAVHTFAKEQDDDLSLLQLTAPVLIPRQPVPLDPAQRSPMTTCTQISLTSAQLKHFNPVPWCRNLLLACIGESSHTDLITTILSEMYANALEHGILGLDSSLKETDEGFMAYYQLRQDALEQLVDAQIDLEIRYCADHRRLRLTITDSGQGFDIEKIHRSSREKTFGRGMMLIDQLCAKVEYRDGGRTLMVEYDLTTDLQED